LARILARVPLPSSRASGTWERRSPRRTTSAASPAASVPLAKVDDEFEEKEVEVQEEFEEFDSFDACKRLLF
jgi:hypothetical protein